MTDSLRPILIAGPTAAGKSALALRLAQAVDGVIVNADALQVYECWRVLSARPDAQEEAAAPHALYGHVGKRQPYSVGHWLREVAALLRTTDKRPIIIGGTGLYFMALTEGLAEIPPTSDDIRAEANVLGAEAMTADLRARDPATVARIDMANPARVQRAWEVWRGTGRGLADWQDDTPPPLIAEDTTKRVLLQADRDWLTDRIDRRFDAMIAQGALAEVAAYIEDGWDPALPSAQAIGARELVAHLQGDLTLAQAVQAAKTQTRQYAKRQRTWFRRRMSGWTTVDPRDPEAAFHKIASGDA